MSAVLKKSLDNNAQRWIERIAISPNNKYIGQASRTGWDSVVRIYDTKSFVLQREIECACEEDWFSFIKFSNDNKYMYTVSGTLEKWLILDDTSGNKPTCCINEHNDSINCIDISSDNKYFVSASQDKTFKLFDLPTEDEGNIVTPIRTFQHTHSVCSVVFTKDAKRIISGLSNGVIRIYNTQDRSLIQSLMDRKSPVNWWTAATFGTSSYMKCLTISLDGGYIFSNSLNTIIMWDLQSGEIVKRFVGHTNYVNDVAISSEGSTLITASDDHTIKIWSLKTAQVLETLVNHNSYVSSVVLSHDDKFIVSASDDDTSKVWDVSAHLPWASLKHVVMQRWLCEKKRASLSSLSSKLEAMDLFVLDANDDVFYLTLSFLMQHKQN